MSLRSKSTISALADNCTSMLGCRAWNAVKRGTSHIDAKAGSTLSFSVARVRGGTKRAVARSSVLRLLRTAE